LGDTEVARRDIFISDSRPKGDIMASQKKRRKAVRLTREQQKPRTGPLRHKDGDRRRRGGMTYGEGLANKRAMQQLGAPAPHDAAEEE
jgi:hypothetical protein